MVNTPRGEFNSLISELGLTITKTTSDGWVYSMERDDGLHLWRVKTSMGCGIQTAWITDGMFRDHSLYMANDIKEALKSASVRQFDKEPLDESF